jgi:hypothetical protein
VVDFNTANGIVTVVPETAAITFNAASGSAVAPITGDVGSPVTAPKNPTKAGFAFSGWLPAIPAAMPIGGLTLTAQWVALGDINGDSKWTVFDVLMTLQAASAKITLTSIQILAADINQSGTVTGIDALKILHFVSGKITQL